MIFSRSHDKSRYPLTCQPTVSMRQQSLLLSLLASTVLSQDDSTWTAPTATDLRSPCPLLNSLANHGYLPHTGANISVPVLLDALDTALNLADSARSFFQLQGNKALTASSTGNASTFHLTDLNTHDLIEHDGSLSRADIGQGDNWSFNSTIFDETKSYWTDATISLTQAAQALHARQQTQKETNPEYKVPLAQHSNALGQTAMYLGLFGDYNDGNAQRDYVVYFFGKSFPSFFIDWWCYGMFFLFVRNEVLICVFLNRKRAVAV